MNYPVKILITFHLADELVEKIREADHRIQVLYEPELLGEPRYLNDQHGFPIKRTPENETRWLELLNQANVLFGYLSWPYAPRIKELAPNLKWIQSPSAGIASAVKRSGWDKTDLMLTTASGIHATPLAEFCLMSMLMFVKDYFQIANDKQCRQWKRNCTTELKTKTLAVVGLGSVGSEVARLARGIGMRVVGNKRHTVGVDPKSVYVDKLYSGEELHQMLSEADFVVLICPLNDETRGMIGKEELASMKKGAILINIARGAIVDEPALIDALQSKHLGGLASDVFSEEPLPLESPFWDMPNVIISPHSASTADTENAKLTELFLNNLSCFLNGNTMRNLLNKELLY